MMLKFAYVLLMTLPALVVASTGEGNAVEHHASVRDLLWPAFNFIILFGALGWKLKKPMSDYFTGKAIEIEKIYNRASERSKEAELKLKMFKDKMANLASERSKILTEAQEEAKNYSKKSEQMTVEKIQRYKKDSESRVEYERDLMIRNINNTLINDVILRTKEIVGNNQQNKDKISEKLVSHLK